MLGLENQFFKSTSLESRKYSKEKRTLLENSEHMKHRQVKIDVSENFDAVKFERPLHFPYATYVACGKAMSEGSSILSIPHSLLHLFNIASAPTRRLGFHPVKRSQIGVTCPNEKDLDAVAFTGKNP